MHSARPGQLGHLVSSFLEIPSELAELCTVDRAGRVEGSRPNEGRDLHTGLLRPSAQLGDLLLGEPDRDRDIAPDGNRLWVLQVELGELLGLVVSSPQAPLRTLIRSRLHLPSSDRSHSVAYHLNDDHIDFPPSVVDRKTLRSARFRWRNRSFAFMIACSISATVSLLVACARLCSSHSIRSNITALLHVLQVGQKATRSPIRIRPNVRRAWCR